MSPPRVLPLVPPTYRVEDEPAVERVCHAIQLLLTDTVATQRGTRIMSAETFAAIKRYLCVAQVQLEEDARRARQ